MWKIVHCLRVWDALFARIKIEQRMKGKSRYFMNWYFDAKLVLSSCHWQVWLYRTFQNHIIVWWRSYIVLLLQTVNVLELKNRCNEWYYDISNFLSKSSTCDRCQWILWEISATRENKKNQIGFTSHQVVVLRGCLKDAMMTCTQTLTIPPLIPNWSRIGTITTPESSTMGHTYLKNQTARSGMDGWFSTRPIQSVQDLLHWANSPFGWNRK